MSDIKFHKNYGLSFKKILNIDNLIDVA